MKRVKRIYPVGLALILLLAACAPAQATPVVTIHSTEIPALQATLPTSPTVESLPTLPAATSAVPTNGDLAREDSQGSVVVVATPLNLDAVGETLDFDVSMNTHSVDLSMDLAILATLTTDAGTTVTPTAWTGQLGGHHVEGTLSFPATVNARAVLDGATSVTLTMLNVDAPQRTFTWQLAP